MSLPLFLEENGTEECERYAYTSKKIYASEDHVI